MLFNSSGAFFCGCFYWCYKEKTFLFPYFKWKRGQTARAAVEAHSDLLNFQGTSYYVLFFGLLSVLEPFAGATVECSDFVLKLPTSVAEVF